VGIPEVKQERPELTNLMEIAAQAKIGPARVGQTFSETLRILGQPSHLDFRYDDMFDGTLRYGPLEIFFRINGENVSSYLVQLHLFRKTTGRNLRINKEISFERPEKADLSYDRVQQSMQDTHVQYKTNTADRVKEGMHPFMEFDEKVRFYFLGFGRGGALQLSYIELGDFRDTTTFR
jgi:hypothetical protein